MSDVQTATQPSGDMPPSLTMSLRIKLSVMMLMQYAVWGAWWVVLAKYIGEGGLGFTGVNVGAVYGTMAIASIFSPMVFGQIADRWVPTQYVLAGLHLVGAGLLYVLTQTTAYTPFFWITLVYAMLYIPTISLTNALSMHNIPNAEKDFPGIRVFGTIGWIVAGLLVGQFLNEVSAEPIMFAAVLSAALGLFCLFLPHTPPAGKPGEALAFLRALSLLKDGVFLLFILTSFLISIVLAGYYAFTSLYLADIGVEKAASIMTVGQFTEMLLLPFLPFFLRTIGMKWTLALGMAAWGIRYAIFAVGEPIPLVVVGLALHGICYDFFFVAAYIHVDNKAGREIRASAQALFNLVSMGLGMYFGNMVFGYFFDNFRTTAGTADWARIWGWPAASVIVVLVIFAIGFRERRKPAGFPVETST